MVLPPLRVFSACECVMPQNPLLGSLVCTLCILCILHLLMTPRWFPALSLFLGSFPTYPAVSWALPFDVHELSLFRTRRLVPSTQSQLLPATGAALPVFSLRTNAWERNRKSSLSSAPPSSHTHPGSRGPTSSTCWISLGITPSLPRLHPSFLAWITLQWLTCQPPIWTSFKAFSTLLLEWSCLSLPKNALVALLRLQSAVSIASHLSHGLVSPGLLPVSLHTYTMPVLSNPDVSLQFPDLGELTSTPLDVWLLLLHMLSPLLLSRPFKTLGGVLWPSTVLWIEVPILCSPPSSTLFAVCLFFFPADWVLRAMSFISTMPRIS